MSRTRNALRLTCSLPVLLALGACVTPPPSGPSFVALPSDGKPFDRFLTEDNYCRQFASSRSGYTSNTGVNSTVAGAGVGTVLGAGAGALIGAAVGDPGAGAAIGAGTGLIGGTSVGASNGALDSENVQQNYNGAYAQCMASYGNKVPAPGQISSYSGASYGGYYPQYASYYGGGYPFYGPGFGFGYGGFYSPFYYGFGYGGFYGHGFYGHGYGHGYGGYGHGYGGGFHGGGGGFHGGGGGFHGGGGHH